MPTEATGEFGLIARLADVLGPASRGARVGIGDDAAVLDPDLVWTCDLLVEDVHFRRATAPAADVGWKALAVTVSDLAAMGAEPVGALVGLAADRSWTPVDLEEVYGGLRECALGTGCPVIGGDVSRGRGLTLAVTALGRASRPVMRAGARPGDVLAVTGSLGGSEAGRLLLEGQPPPAGIDAGPLVERHRRPVPRLAEARALAPLVSAMLDVSDGVAGDAARLADASDVGVTVDLDALPLHAGVAAVARAAGRHPAAFAAGAGEEYELLVAVAPGLLDELPVPVTRIGTVRERRAGGRAVTLVGSGADAVASGWDHLGERP